MNPKRRCTLPINHHFDTGGNTVSADETSSCQVCLWKILENLKHKFGGEFLGPRNGHPGGTSKTQE